MIEIITLEEVATPEDVVIIIILGDGYNNFISQKNLNFKNHKKWSATLAKDNKGPPNNPTMANDICRKCRERGHWSRICRASKQKVEQYQASIRTAETNLLEEWENSDIPSGYTIGNTHLDCSVFFRMKMESLSLMRHSI